MSNPALDTYLMPLQAIFAEDGVNEISINSPKEVWIEKYGSIFKKEAPELDYDHLRGLSNLVAQSTEQVVSEEKPLLSGTLPNGFRIQIVLPPATESKKVIMSIRKPSVLSMTIDDYEKSGCFEHTQTSGEENEKESEIEQCIKDRRIKDLLRLAIVSKKNLIISGGTSTGKTTFSNALLQEIPIEERILTIEDAREVKLDKHENKVHLISSKGGQGRAKVTTQDLIEASLRLRPDRIILGELRGSEAFAFLRAINTGHPGSIATLHADRPLMALEQIKLMVLQAGLNIPAEYIKDYIINVIDLVVQLKRGNNGTRYVSEILHTKSLRNQGTPL